jgi:hypothetical protein
VVVGILVIRATLADVLDERRWRRQQLERREESSDGQSGG